MTFWLGFVYVRLQYLVATCQHLWLCYGSNSLNPVACVWCLPIVIFRCRYGESGEYITEKDNTRRIYSNQQFYWQGNFYAIMMTSSNGNIFRVTCPLCGEFTGPGEVPAQRPVTRTLVFSLICAWIHDWVNSREAGDLRRHHGHYDVIIMVIQMSKRWWLVCSK